MNQMTPEEIKNKWDNQKRPKPRKYQLIETYERDHDLDSKPEKTDDEKYSYTVTKKAYKILKDLNNIYHNFKDTNVKINPFYVYEIIKWLPELFGFPDIVLSPENIEIIKGLILTNNGESNIFDDWLIKEINNPRANIRIKIGSLALLNKVKYNVELPSYMKDGIYEIRFGNKVKLKKNDLFNKIIIAVNRVLEEYEYLDTVMEIIDPNGLKRKHEQEVKEKLMKEKEEKERRHKNYQYLIAVKTLMEGAEIYQNYNNMEDIENFALKIEAFLDSDRFIRRMIRKMNYRGWNKEKQDKYIAYLKSQINKMHNVDISIDIDL